MQSETPEGAAPAGLKKAGIAVAVLAVAIVAVGSVTRAHDKGDAQHWADDRAVPTVHLVAAKDGAASDSLTLPGTTAAWNAANIYARVGGYLKHWDKDIGAQVGDGTPLATIDTPELDQQIAQARADLASARANAALAKSTAARWNDLLTTNSVSHQEADEKNGAYTARAAGVQASEASLGRLLALKQFATVRAPFGGVVTTRTADIGDLVGPGATAQQPMFSIADVHRIRIYVGVPQVYAAAMTPGLRATLSVPDYPGKTFDAQVIGTSGAINGRTGTLQVQLVADNASHTLKPGGYAEVKFATPGRASSVQIPSSALIFRAAGTQVATVDNGRVKLQSIRIGRDLGQAVEVVSGLPAHAQVVDNPPDSIADGQQVHVEAGHA